METDALFSVLEKARTDYAIPHRLREASEEFGREVLAFLFPHFTRGIDQRALPDQLTGLEAIIDEVVAPLSPEPEATCGRIRQKFRDEILGVRETLLSDAEAMLNHDPAAVNRDEVILAYPGFLAIAVYRVAHLFCEADVPFFPRLLSEFAHRETGIDIHPGAKIGRSFSIDHGTGIVIGGTAEIGSRVRIFQGVTLGALSVKKELRATKRHPTIEDDVVIYANATILGGSTVVGRGSVIGGNVWLTRSVPAESVVTHASTMTAPGAEPEMLLDYYL